LVDAASGDVLASHDPKSAFPIASATKLMTYSVAAERLRPSREIVVAPYDAIPGESLAGFEPGDSITVRDALYGLMVPSGNDAALTLAVAVSGSEADFVDRMNAAAAELGLGETSYADPIGLDAQNLSSARDLVALSQELRKQRLFRRIVDTPRVTLRSGAEPLRIENRNQLVIEEPFMDGIKTGTTLAAGYILVGSGSKKGVDLISVVLGASDEASRDAATLELLDYGFSLYENRAIVKRGERVGFAYVEGGGRVPLEAAAAIKEVSRADQRVEVRFEETPSVARPLARGEPVGVAVVKLDGTRVGTVDAVTARNLPGLPEAAVGGQGLPSWAWIVFACAGILALFLLGMAIRAHRRDER
jgi:D-alanyl-D-alanine carboxypeptidase (penicillin-binding protein 5/6)